MGTVDCSKKKKRALSGKTYKMATKCACLTLHKSARIIGTLLFMITVGPFAAYLIFIEDLRRSVVEKLFDISPCSQPWIDIIVDSLFVNLLLIGTCVGCTRWVLVPWLILYAINILQ